LSIQKEPNLNNLLTVTQPRDDVYGAYDASYLSKNEAPNQHTQSPVVTGTSVVALKFKDGVVIAADNLGR
jgi:20S proteasome subunit beta 7